MRARFFQTVDLLRTSYWFVPTILSLSSVALFLLTSWLDHRFDASWLEAMPWLGASQPAGARALLSTIASSMIGVAGVTFSITIAAVSFASANFGPRLLTNFMRDRGNQITLGTFIATYIYCLLALRLVRSADATVSEADAVFFVPQITVLGALGMAIASLSVLIFFLHHVPASIRISTVVAKIGRSLEEKVGSLFPSGLGEAAPDESMIDPPKGAQPLLSQRSGYVQNIDSATLISAAKEKDVVFWLEVRPGDFVYTDQVLGLIESSESLEHADLQSLHSAFAFGWNRTQQQDFLFLVDELVEIAARALSPGVNDPITAMACLDWLGSGLTEVSRRSDPEAQRRDEDDQVRVVATVIDYQEIVGRSFEQLRPYISSDLNTTLYAFSVLARVSSVTVKSEQRDVLRRTGLRLMESAKDNHRLPNARRAFARSLLELRKCSKGLDSSLSQRWVETDEQVARA